MEETYILLVKRIETLEKELKEKGKEIERLNQMLEEKFMKENPLLVENGIICKKDREIKRLKELIDKYDKELTHKTKQYEYLRHYHNLPLRKQYVIEQDKEINRLNNIINELEECLESAYSYEGVDYTIKRNGKPEIVYNFEEVKQWIQELKGE